MSFYGRVLSEIGRNMTNYCINCLTELNALDDDPNGCKNCVCARCRAEEAHDFDAEPNVRFDRAGSIIEKGAKNA